MEFAVIKTGGKQYKVSVGDVVKVEKITGDFKVGDKVTFDKVLEAISNNNYEFFFSNRQTNVVYEQAHNEFLEWFFISGWIGLIFLILLILRLLYYSYTDKDKTNFYGLIITIITTFFFFTLHIFPLALIIILYVALIDGGKEWQRQTHITGL